MIVSIPNAKQTALNFLNNNGNKARGLPNYSESNITEVQTIENENGTPILYALNLGNNEGFVVMSASLVEKPILAFNNEGKFDFENLGEFAGVVDWAYTKYLKINGLIEIGKTPSQSILNQWSVVNPALEIGIADQNGNIIPWVPLEIIDQWDVSTTYGPFMTTRWNQRISTTANSTVMGYNNFVGSNNCNTGIAPAGCVAVAMGQIMKYHNFPNLYNINSMPDVVNTSNYDNANAKNIARLLQNIGQKVNMQYSCTGSSAYSADARTAFVTQYGYYTSNLSPMDLNSIVMNLTTESLPVYLDGCRDKIVKTSPRKTGIFRFTVGRTTYTYENCHAWVTDGYQKIDRTVVYENNHTSTYTIAEHIRMNWGWGDSGYNGWFDYERWETINGQVIQAVEFIYNQHMIYNIQPN